MTNTATNIRVPSDQTIIDTVLFDLSGTLLDESYARHGLAHLADEIHARWGIDHQITFTGFMPMIHVVTAEYTDQCFYLMSDVFCAALDRLITSHGHRATPDDLLDLHDQFWAAAERWVELADGAVETLAGLRSAGIRTGIVSYADTWVFERLLVLSGLADLVDVAVCSETARSCKPDPAIFHHALDAIGASPGDAMFVGDSIKDDVVGANRVGMHTAHLTPGQFTLRHDESQDPNSRPDHHIEHLSDVADLVLGSQPFTRCA